MDNFDLDTIDWFSPETRVLYERIDKVFSKGAKKRFSVIKHIKIDPEEFNDIIKEINNSTRTYKWAYKVNVRICIDLSKPVADTMDIVEGTQNMLDVATKMMSSDLLADNKLLQSYEVNNKSFCEGYLEYY